MSTPSLVILVIALYALGLGLLHILGGLAAAAEAFKRWGAASARAEHPQIHEQRDSESERNAR